MKKKTTNFDTMLRKFTLILVSICTETGGFKNKNTYENIAVLAGISDIISLKLHKQIIIVFF